MPVSRPPVCIIFYTLHIECHLEASRQFNLLQTSTSCRHRNWNLALVLFLTRIWLHACRFYFFQNLTHPCEQGFSFFPNLWCGWSGGGHPWDDLARFGYIHTAQLASCLLVLSICLCKCIHNIDLFCFINLFCANASITLFYFVSSICLCKCIHNIVLFCFINLLHT